MGTPRPGGNGRRKSKLFDDYHAVMVKLPTELYRRFKSRAEADGTSPSARARDLITEYMNGSAEKKP